MKRFHVHVGVRDIEANIGFYSRLFGRRPDKVRADYAKWVLEDPHVNFAISSRSGRTGVDHFGFQASDAESLAGLRARAAEASGDALLDEGRADCCYARSDKHWTVDPQGLAWEHFVTMGEVREYGEEHGPGAACCAPDTASAMPGRTADD